MRKTPDMTDRERILMNIAAELACELARCQSLPAVKEYMRASSFGPSVIAEYGRGPYNKGDLVVCHTSAGRQQNPWVVSFVEATGAKNDPGGLLLRAIGTKKLCDYGNESFIRIRGISPRLLWEGRRQQFAVKVSRAFRKLDEYIHVFRGLEFDRARDDLARVYIGERYGGLGRPTKPYVIEIVFRPRTTIKNIIAQMREQGFGTRSFEPDDGTYTGPMQGLAKIARADLVNELGALGIEVKTPSAT